MLGTEGPTNQRARGDRDTQRQRGAQNYASELQLSFLRHLPYVPCHQNAQNPTRALAFFHGVPETSPGWPGPRLRVLLARRP